MTRKTHNYGIFAPMCISCAAERGDLALKLATMGDSGELSLKSKITLTIGGVLLALAVEAGMKLFRRLTKPASAEKGAAAVSKSAPPSAAKAVAKAVVTVQYCG